ncbi:hypothetical protein [Neobacillus sp. NPDC093127]
MAKNMVIAGDYTEKDVVLSGPNVVISGEGIIIQSISNKLFFPFLK